MREITEERIDILPEEQGFSWLDPELRRLIDANKTELGFSTIEIDRCLDHIRPECISGYPASIYPANLVGDFLADVDTNLRPRWAHVYQERTAAESRFDLGGMRRISDRETMPTFNRNFGAIYGNRNWVDTRRSEFGARGLANAVNLMETARLKLEQIRLASVNESRHYKKEFADFRKFCAQLIELLQKFDQHDLEAARTKQVDVNELLRLAQGFKMAGWRAMSSYQPGFLAADARRGRNPIQESMSLAFFQQAYGVLYNLSIFCSENPAQLKHYDAATVTDGIVLHLDAPLRLTEYQRRFTLLRKHLAN